MSEIATNAPEVLSVVVPCFNEVEVLPAFHARLSRTLETVSLASEIIYVNDGSSDGTLEELRRLKRMDPRIAIVNLSRNFGKDIALTAGMDHAKGDAVVVLDADLQDPPELIPSLIEKWRAGNDVVYAKRRRRYGDGVLRRLTTFLFYRIIRKVNRVAIPADTGDYRLITRRVVDALKQLREQHRFMKGLFAWVGFSQTAVLYDRDPRFAGRSSWNLWKLWNFAIEGITSFTIGPLKLASYFGLLVASSAFLYAAYIVVRTLAYGNPVAGYPSEMVAILFIGGVQLMAIGVLGEYVGRMFDETKRRPLYVVMGYTPAERTNLPGEVSGEAGAPLGEHSHEVATTPLMERPAPGEWRITTHLAPFLVVLAASVAVTCWWVLTEQDYYQGDWGRTHQMLIDQAALFRRWPGGALLHGVRASLGADYNQLVVLPLLPFILLFGESRLVFELAVVLVYQLPFALVVGGIATKLIPTRAAAVFWSAAGLVLLTPAVWVPTLRGYPDLCSAFFLALAVLFYLQDPAFRRWWQIPVLGFCLSMAMILRRHFAYAVVALFVAWGVTSLAMFVGQHGRSFREVVRSWSMRIVRIGLVGVSAFLWTAILAWPFLDLVTSTSYRSLYRSYNFPPLELIRSYVGAFGWGPWLLAVGGLVAGIHFRKVERSAAWFLLVFGTYSYVQWAFVVGVRSIHFANHFSLVVVLGLVSLVWAVYQSTRGRQRLLLLGSIALYLVVNAVIGMVKLSGKESPGVAQIATSFAPNHSPIVRENYAEIGRLVDYLRDVAPGQKIFVAASSFALDYTLLVNAERLVHGREHTVLAFLGTPAVDSHSELPLSQLLKAQFVIVPSTLEVQQTTGASEWEYHLPRDQQTVVKVAWLAFTEGWPIAEDFEQLPVQFTLAANSRVNVYRRVRPTSVSSALATLERMEEFFEERPPGQPAWIVLRSPGSHDFSIHPGDSSVTYLAKLSEADTAWTVTIAFIGAVPRSPTIRGRLESVDSGCVPEVVLGASSVDAFGTRGKRSSVGLRSVGSPEFAVSLGRTDAKYLVLDLSGMVSGNALPCRMRLMRLRVERGLDEPAS